MARLPVTAKLVIGVGLLAVVSGLGAAGWMATGGLSGAPAEPLVERVYAPIDSPYGHVTPQPVAAALGPEPEPLDFNVIGMGDAGDGGDGALVVSRNGRLVGAATATPAPTATPEPTATLIPRPTRGPYSVEEWIELPEGWLELDCDQQFRQALLQWEGDPADFDVTVADELADEVEAREGCGDSGWQPVFSFHTGCPGRYREIDGIEISAQLRVLRYEVKTPFLGPTARDGAGNILVHFRELPREDISGCWYYSARERIWLWSGPHPASEHRLREGREPYVFPECGYMLRRHFAGFSGDAFSVAAAARLMDRVRLDHSTQCDDPNWDFFPQRAAREHCQPQQETGFDAGGDLLVVNWHEHYSPRDGAVCWVLERGTGVWYDYYGEEG